MGVAMVGGFQVAANLQKVKANGKAAKPGILKMGAHCETQSEDGLQYSIPRYSQLPATYLMASSLTGEEANPLSRKALSNFAGTIAADNKTLNPDCMPVGLVPTHVQGSPCVDMHTHRPMIRRSESLFLLLLMLLLLRLLLLGTCQLL